MIGMPLMAQIAIAIKSISVYNMKWRQFALLLLLPMLYMIPFKSMAQDFTFKQVADKLKKDKPSYVLYKEYFSMYLIDKTLCQKLHDSTDYFVTYNIITYNKMLPLPRLISTEAMEKSFLHRIDQVKPNTGYLSFSERSHNFLQKRRKLKRIYSNLVSDINNYNPMLLGDNGLQEEYFRKFMLYYHINPETE